MREPMSGGCGCGRVRYEARPDDDDAYLCHCRMCQRASGSVSLALAGMAKSAIRWLSEPDRYESSPIARRPFCARCGTSLGFAYHDSERMDLTVASFDDPSCFVPRYHFGTESMHDAWLDTSRLARTPSDEYPPLVERWKAARGETR